MTAPLWVPPDEVREAFVQLRTEMLRGPKPGPVSEKRARMAVFAAEHNTGITWKKLLVLWNRKHPEYRFDDESRFIRDCRQTYELITGERLGWRNAPTSRREKS